MTRDDPEGALKLALLEFILNHASINDLGLIEIDKDSLNELIRIASQFVPEGDREEFAEELRRIRMSPPGPHQN